MASAEFDCFTLDVFGCMAINERSIDPSTNSSADPLRMALRLAASKREPSLIAATDNRIAAAVKAWLNDGGAMPVSRAIERLDSTTNSENLSEIESNILDALGGETLTGEQISRKAGYPFNSTFKAVLASLRRRNILENLSPGYRVKP